MKKLSKNVEMTGERERAYDRWRASLPLKWVSVPFLEYSRRSGRAVSDWPLFTIHAAIHPAQTSSDAVPSKADLLAALYRHRETLIGFNLIARRVTFPAFLGVMNRSREYVLTQQFPRWDRQTQQPRQPHLHTAQQFVETVLKHPWQPAQLACAPNTPDRPFASYSRWHRQAMPGRACVMDIDYIEVRDRQPVALIEVTQSNSNDLAQGLFAFLSRGFAQASMLLLVAEDLGIESYILAYREDLSAVELLKLERTLLPRIDRVDRERQSLARAARERGAENSVAQGEAVRTLYTTQGAALLESLAPNRRRMSLDTYQHWLYTQKAR
ncbi:MAG TPA: hypothetical protein VGF67_18710 [Ktedonobacteraceae bacterium]|jgi:hypothetical protein